MSATTSAVVALCESAGTPPNAYAGKVYVTVAPAPILAKPYIIVHPNQGTDEAARFMGPPTTEYPEYTLHIVGNSASSVETVTANIKAKFHTNGFFIPPTVSGRRNTRGYWRMPTPINTDHDVTPWLVYAVIELGWVSEPA